MVLALAMILTLIINFKHKSIMKEKELYCVFHYIPLHSAPAGEKFGRFDGEDEFTTKESERLVRLPMYYGLREDQVDLVVEGIKEFFSK